MIRLTTELWAHSYITRLRLKGIPSFVTQKGDLNAGTVFVKQQAYQLFDLFKRKTNNLENPSEPIGHGILVLFAGALLLTPGFFTDIFGFLLLIPAFRYWLIKQLQKRFLHVRDLDVETSNQNENIYDAEYTDVTPNDRSPWKKPPTTKD